MLHKAENLNMIAATPSRFAAVELYCLDKPGEKKIICLALT
jgi:hypothetical protein